MDAFMYWTGVIVWLAVLGAASWLFIGELLIVGLANSISFHRWNLTSPTSTFTWRKHWWPLLKSVAKEAIGFAGYRNNGSQRRYAPSGGEWRGIGDWTPIQKEREETP